jgi:hypothetical protein
VKEDDPIGTDARDAEHVRQLGPGPHLCAFCGLTDPRVLIPKPLAWVTARGSRSVLDEHHVVGRNHDARLIVLLCVLCHFKVHQCYLQAGIDLRLEPDPYERVARMLEARAVFSELEAESFREWAALLRTGHEGSSDGTENH